MAVWPNEASTQILAVGPGCELLEPAELRTRIAEEARRLASRYEPQAAGAEQPPRSLTSRSS